MYISSPDLSSALQTPIPNFLLYVSVSKNISSAITLHEALDSLSPSLLLSLHLNQCFHDFPRRSTGNPRIILGLPSYLTVPR